MCISRNSISISIEYSNPSAVFYPGGELSGIVVLQVTRPIRARSVCVSVHGRAETYWTETEYDTETDADGHTHTVSHTIVYKATVVYVRGDNEVWSDNPRKKKLRPGVHRFPFRFVLPLTCAPSFEGYYGDIRYHVEVEVDIPWGCNKRESRRFKVPSTLDLNTVPQAIQPTQCMVRKDVGLLLFSHGVIIMQAWIPKMGFAPGETIVVDVVIENGSTRPVIRADFRLVQSTRYRAARNGWFAYYETGLNARTRCRDTRSEVETVASRNMCLAIAPKSKSSVRFLLVVPPTRASFNLCPIITVEYYVEVTIVSEGSVNNVLTGDCPVLIGTVPIRTAGLVPTVVPFVSSARPTSTLSSPSR